MTDNKYATREEMEQLIKLVGQLVERINKFDAANMKLHMANADALNAIVAMFKRKDQADAEKAAEQIEKVIIP